jgi:hypothetical protein
MVARSSDLTVVVTIPDHPWSLFRSTAHGRTSWAVEEVVLGGTTGYALALPDQPTPDELRAAMVGSCGRPIADTLIDEACQRAPGSLGPEWDEDDRTAAS